MGSDASKLSLAKLLPQQVVAVLLAWLTNVAGEAIHGWFQFRSDAFEKLIKVYHIHSFKYDSI